MVGRMSDVMCPFCLVRPATLLCDFVIGFEWSGEMAPCHRAVVLKDGRRDSRPTGEYYRVYADEPEMFTCDRPMCEECGTRKSWIFFPKSAGGPQSVDHCPQCEAEAQSDYEAAKPITALEANAMRRQMWKRSTGLLRELTTNPPTE